MTDKKKPLTGRALQNANVTVFKSLLNEYAKAKDEIVLYSSHHKLYISINQKITSPGEIWIYNTVGQLLTQQQIYSGSNTIDPKVTDQIIIVKVIVEGKVYQKKLLMN